MDQNYSTQATGGNGYGSDYGIYCMSLAHQIAELRREVGETECGIKETIHAQSLANGAEFCGVNKNISDNGTRNVLATLENRAAIKDTACMLDKSILENRYILADKLDREGDEIKLQMNQFERQTAENFCAVKGEIKDSERRILDRLTSDKIDEKNSLIDELRHLNRHKDNEIFIGNRFASLEAMVNSIRQENATTNKSVIFGSGTNTTTNKQNNT